MMELKPFQRATVQHVITQLEEHGRFLVADEVGLGKTIVARGVIEQLYKQYSSKDDPLHVVYICSNQLLAGQNIRKLCPPNAKARNAHNRLFLMVQEPIGARESPQSDQALNPSIS